MGTPALANGDRPMGFVLSLEEVCRRPERLVGGKAKGLGWLDSLGVPVPAAVCVTTDAYRKIMEAPGLQALERSALGDRDPGAAAALRAAVLRAELPAELIEEMERALSRLSSASKRPELHLAVRSSAVGEDSARASFAGQFESVLNVRSLEQVLDAIRHCWASLWSEHALAYRRQSGLNPDADWAMGVVIQHLVPADAAGVAFSVHPVTGRDDVVVVNSGFGLAANLVSGEHAADLFVVEKRGGRIVEQVIAEKKTRTIVHPTRGIGEVATDPSEVRSHSIESESLAKLVDWVVRVEAAAGAPVDVEWVLLDGSLSLVQSRRVTRRLREPDAAVRVSWTLASELFPQPIVPWDAFLFQIFLDAYNARRAEWGDAGLEMKVREIDGYLYMTEIASKTGTKESSDPEVARRLLQRSVPADWHGHVRDRLQREFRRWLDVDLRPLEARELFMLVEQLVEERLAQEAAGLPAGMVPGFAMEDLRQTLEGTFGDETDSVVARLLQGLPSLTQALERGLCELVEEIRADAGWKELLTRGGLEEASARALAAEGIGRRIRGFLDEWGFHGMDGILSRPWHEQPEQLVCVLRSRMDRVGEDPAVRLRRLEQERADEARTVEARLPESVRAEFRERLRLAEACVPLNQDRHMVVVENGYAALRRVLIALGAKLCEAGVLANEDDVFFMSLDELERAATDPTPRGRAEFAARRDAWTEAFRRSPAPKLLEVSGRGYEPDVGEASTGEESRALTGLAASPGLARGRARVLEAISQIGTVRRGDVLVTHMTTPAWTPFFAVLAGVVTETGSLLSHPAVLAREYGIPAVVSVQGATRALTTGADVVVDGDRGRVFEVCAAESAGGAHA